MSKRLQVILDDSEYRDLMKTARKQGMSVSEWVRQAIRTVRRHEPIQDIGPKLSAVREAARHSYPTADIEVMLADIERGYLGGGQDE